jgi:hypothetical protein
VFDRLRSMLFERLIWGRKGSYKGKAIPYGHHYKEKEEEPDNQSPADDDQYKRQQDNYRKKEKMLNMGRHLSNLVLDGLPL